MSSRPVRRQRLTRFDAHPRSPHTAPRGRGRVNARRRLASLLLATPLLLATSAAGCSNVEHAATPASAGTVSADTTGPGMCGPGELGLTAVTADMSPDLLERQASGFVDHHFGAVRLTIQWPHINSTYGEYDWAATDALVDTFHSRGISILGVATWAPSWAVPEEYRLVKHPAPADPAVFAEFALAAAERYADRIRTWEIWNEPNIGSTFGPRVNPELYAAMLEQSYVAIKQFDPDIVVLSGATSPTVDNATDLSPQTFVTRLYELGAGKYFDGLAMHPYSASGSLSTYSGTANSATAIADIRELMVERGDANKRIWFTELGFPTGGPQPYSEAEQAALLVDSIRYLRSLDYCGGIFLFDYRDVATGSDVSEFNYGLLRSDFTPKLSLRAVQEAN